MWSQLLMKLRNVRSESERRKEVKKTTELGFRSGSITLAEKTLEWSLKWLLLNGDAEDI